MHLQLTAACEKNNHYNADCVVTDFAHLCGCACVTCITIVINKHVRDRTEG
jgi:hypothetical protein